MKVNKYNKCSGGGGGSYDEGYNQGQADIAANARVLNVTKNGEYLSKFSDPIPPTLVTGIYADGTKFHNYAELNGKIFNTKIAGSIDRRLEFWYKGDNATNYWDAIIGAGNVDNKDCFQVRYWDNNNGKLLIEIGNSGVIHSNWDDTVWHHLIISKAEGLWIDGEKKYDFKSSNTVNGEFLINGTGYNADGTRNANGCFGMIKIDDTIIIPTADGFLNTNTGELLEVVKDGGYTFTENLLTYGEGELYKTINVNVPDLNGSYDEGKTDGVNEQKSKLESINITENGVYSKEDGYNQIEVNVIPKINIQEAGINFSYSTFTEVPEWADFKDVTNMTRMFQNCYKLQTIPLLDTSNVADMSSMFHNCSNLQTIHQIDTSNVTSMNYMFFNCSNLQTIPAIDTSNVADMSSMFAHCGNLKTLPELDVSKVNRIDAYFEKGGSNVTDVGGWKNLKINWNDNYGLARCPNLTHQSCINILNGLYDFVGNGSTETRTLKVHPNFLTTVGNEISIGTSKGWTITA